MHHVHRRGLTLVEILVVVVVLVVAACLLIPALRQKREVHRRHPCASNLAQIGKACVMYSNVKGNNGLYPDDGKSALKSLSMVYNTYIKDPQVLLCPETESFNTEQIKALSATTHNLDKSMTTYGYDRHHGQEDGIPGIAGDIAGSPGKGVMDASDNSTNHGKKDGKGAGQNILSAQGSVDWFEVPFTTTNGKKDHFFAPGPEIDGIEDTVLKDD